MDGELGMGMGAVPRLWAYPTPPIPGVPVGLECLARLTNIFVLQQVEIMEVITGWETNNRYEVVNAEGHRLFFAMEATGMMDRQFHGSNRRFQFALFNAAGQEVAHLSRDANGMGCGACCGVSKDLVVSSPPGSVVGKLVQTSGCCRGLELDVSDPGGRALVRVIGPCCTFGFAEDFPVVGSDRVSKVGNITKYWGGYGKELYTNADNFGVSFPADLDVRVKAQLIAAVILLDFIFFEHRKDNNAHDHHR